MLSFFFPSLFSGSTRRYRKAAAFSAAGSIHAIAISLDGQLVAAGGTDGIKLWNIQTSNEVTATAHLESRGIVSSAVWMKTKHTAAETLCYGTGSGYIVFIHSSPIDKQFQEICARRLGSGFEITCLAWDSSTPDASRIAVGTRDNVIQVLSLSNSSQIQSVFAGRFDSTVPKAISFADHGNLYIFGLYDGNVVKMSGKDGTILSEYHCRSVIGSAAVYLKRGVFVIDNATSGFTMYHLDGGEPIRTFITDPPSIQVPKQVAFGEDYRVVVGGSDKGTVFVFDRRTGNVLDTIQHASATLVQTIAVRDVGGRCIIACTSPPVGRKRALITIWTHQYVRKEKSTDTTCRWFRWLMHVAIILCAAVGIQLPFMRDFVGMAGKLNDLVISKSQDLFPLREPTHLLQGEGTGSRHQHIDPMVLQELAQQIIEVLQVDREGGDMTGASTMSGPAPEIQRCAGGAGDGRNLEKKEQLPEVIYL